MISQIRDVAATSRVTAVTVSDDGSLVALGTETVVELFAVASGKALRQIQLETAASGLAISADNRLLAVATDAPTVTVYDRESGEIMHRFVRSTMPDFLRDKCQRRVAFMSNTSSLITYGEGDTMAIWNCESSDWEHLIRIPWPNSSAVVAISHDGHQLAVVCEPNPRAYMGQVTMYRVHQGLQHLWNRRHESEKAVTSAAFSPDGSKLVTCGAGDGIRTWNVKSGEQVDHIEEAADHVFSAIAFTCDSDHLLVVNPRSLEVRRLKSNNAQATATSRQPGDVRGFSASATGKVVATYNSDAIVELWSVDISAQASN